MQFVFIILYKTISNLNKDEIIPSEPDLFLGKHSFEIDEPDLLDEVNIIDEDVIDFDIEEEALYKNKKKK